MSAVRRQAGQLLVPNCGRCRRLAGREYRLASFSADRLARPYKRSELCGLETKPKCHGSKVVHHVIDSRTSFHIAKNSFIYNTCDLIDDSVINEIK